MKLVMLNEKQVGKVLSMPIYTKGGMIFIKQGTILTSRVVQRLNNIGIVSGYIEDENTDVILKDVIETNEKFALLEQMKTMYTNIKKTGTLDSGLLQEIVKKFLSVIDISENSINVNNYITDEEIMNLAIHSLNVTIFVTKAAIARGYNALKTEEIIKSAFLHDIGKLVPSNGKKHYENAYNIVRSANTFSPLVFVPILHLHERVDGNGALKVKGESLHEYSQILHLCNNYTNLSEKGILPYEIVEKMTVDALSKFSIEVFKDCMSVAYVYPNGVEVLLNNGLKGIVLKQNKGATTRPIIGAGYGTERVILDLTKELTLFIKKIEL